jgi:hypothetical protein
MIQVRQITLLLFLIFWALSSCSNPFGSLGNRDIELTPEDYEEAALMALALSGELVAPDSLYNQVLEELPGIRSTYGDSYGSIQRIRFRAPWVPGMLIIGFDSTTAQMVDDGEYHAWDQLNGQYQVTEIDTFSIRYGYVVLHFNEKYHPRRLAEKYEVLPGVRYAEPNRLGGDFSNVYPRLTTQGITYLFREGWGDCPSGCISNLYWYFDAEWHHPVLIGYWDPQNSPKEPNWWHEAEQNIESYYRY